MLKQRILSALVMAPPALAAVWFGGWAFVALIALVTALMVWEWHGMILKEFSWSGRITAALLLLAVVGVPILPVFSAVCVLLAGVLAAVLSPRLPVWMVGGVFYIGLPALALVWMRGADDLGRQVILWLFLLVWATDSGAYAFGRLIGGPLLLPAVSPKKTWAGLLGGGLSAAVAGLALSYGLGWGNGLFLALFSAVMAVVAQAGDLFESWVKRRWEVKDSSAIIPGHGGVLDRVDGVLTVAVLVALLQWVTGASIIQW